MAGPQVCQNIEIVQISFPMWVLDSTQEVHWLHVPKNHICFENTPRRSPTVHIYDVEYIIISNQKRGKK